LAPVTEHEALGSQGAVHTIGSAGPHVDLSGTLALPGLDAPPRPRSPRRIALPRDSVYRRALGVADVLAALASLIVLRVVGETPLSPKTFLALPLALLLGKLLGLYDREERVIWSSTLDEAPLVVVMALIYTVVLWLASDSFVPGSVHKGQFLLAFITMAGCVLGGRMIARAAAGSLTERERCLVLGESASFDRVRKRLKFGETGAAEVVLGIPVEAGRFAHFAAEGLLREVVEEYRIQRVVIAAGAHDTEAMLELIRQAGGLNVKISVLPQFWETLGSLVVDEMPGTAMLAVRRFGLTKSSQVVKRGFDFALSAAVVVLLAPLMGALALLVRLTSPGPVLFRQERVGRHGEIFEMLKFRSMCSDAEARRTELYPLNQAVGIFKIRNDPRITPLGRWLRRTNLDELPQLFNVLKGQMSLVGPRPLIPDEDAGIVGWRRRRLDVPPGMTGHWQVLGGARVPLDEMVVIDYLYIANWSLWRDVKCLLRTASCVLARRGI
jgi:exopolysaccharide biosynthesis polyprenyl glycosylphosphotransferase